MKRFEKSCGVVVFTRQDGEVKYVLAQALGGHYGFPKGHTEPGETEEQTALREVYEEVGLKPELLKGFRETVEYDIPELNVHKQVVFFLGEYKGQQIAVQEAELRSAPLVAYGDARSLLTHGDSKAVLMAAHSFLHPEEAAQSQGRKYYEAYDDRYRQIHAKALEWSGGESSPIVAQTIEKYNIQKNQNLLELGCGEGRDAWPLLDQGFRLLATDVAPAAIRFCREKYPQYAERFQVLDCVAGDLEGRFDFIYAVAVIHMLVPDEDRDGFYTFIREHLTEEGIGLICTMGDGTVQRHSDIRNAFQVQQRIHEATGTPVQVAATSCRMVSFPTFRAELERNGLKVVESGLTCVEKDFPVMMYAVVKGE